MPEKNLHELKSFATERGISVRSLRKNYPDIIYTDCGKSYIDVAAYGELLPQRARKGKRKRNNSPLSKTNRLLRGIRNRDKVIQARVIEANSLTELRKALNDPIEQKTTDLKIKNVRNEITVLESKNDRARNEIDKILAIELGN